MKAVFLFFFLVTSIGGQAATQLSSTNDKKSDETELRAKTISLVNEVKTLADSLRLPENRILLKLDLMPMLQETAPNELQEIINQIRNEFISLLKNPDEINSERKIRLRHLRGFITQKFSEVAPSLARDFYNATNINDDENPRNDAPNNFELEQLISCFDSESADKELSIAISKKQFDHNLISKLGSIALRDFKRAAELANMMAENVLAENLLANEEAAAMAYSLVQRAKQIDKTIEEKTTKYEGATRLLSKAKQAEILSKYVSQRIPKNISNLTEERRETVKIDLSNLIGRDDYSNGLALPAAKLEELKRLAIKIDPQYRKSQEIEQRSFAESLAALGKVTESEKHELFQSLPYMLKTKADCDLFKDYVRKEIKDVQEKSKLLAGIDQSLLWISVNSADHETALLLIDQSKPKTERKYQVTMMLSLLHKVVAQNDKQKIADITQRTLSILHQMPRNSEQFSFSMQLATIVSEATPDKSFEIMSDVSNQLASLIPATAQFLSFKDDRAFNDDELIFDEASDLNNWLGEYAKALANLAPQNFERTKKLADTSSRLDVRIKIYSILCRELLKVEPITCDDLRW